MSERLKRILMMDYATRNQNNSNTGLLDNKNQNGLLGNFANINPNFLVGANLIGAGLKGQDPFSAFVPSVFQAAQVKKALQPKLQKTKPVFDNKLGKEVFITEKQLQEGNAKEPLRYTGKPEESAASKLETNLGKTYMGSKVVTDFNVSSTQVKKLLKSLDKKDGVGDLGAIFTFMKVLDPGSVVREGEFATAENSAGAFRKFWNLHNKLLRGERLTTTQRDQFKDLGINLYTSSVESLDNYRLGFGEIATNKGLNTSNIFVDVDFRPKTIELPNGKRIKTPPGASLLDYRNGKYYWKIPGFEEPYEADGRGQ